MAAIKFKKEEIDWLKENYPTLGVSESAKYLNRNEQSIRRICCIHKIKCRKIFDYSYCEINLEDPKFIYFLGFTWADGHVSNKGVYTSIQEEDGEKLKEVFSSFGDFKIRNIERKKKKNIVEFVSRNRNLYQFLSKYSYQDKSRIEPTEILSVIPEELKYYWWRGFFDGDGSIHSKQSSALSFSGPFCQKWDDAKTLFKNHKCSYIISYNKNKTGSNSLIKVWRQIDILKIGFYLYPNLEFDFGLQRKFEKLQIVLNKFLIKEQKKYRVVDGVLIKKANYKESKLSRRTFEKKDHPSLESLFDLYFSRKSLLYGKCLNAGHPE